MKKTLPYANDPAWTGIGGYLKASNRTRVSDENLVQAAFYLRFTYQELFLWCNSRCARHFMDANKTGVNDFARALVSDMPGLKEEVGL